MRSSKYLGLIMAVGFTLTSIPAGCGNSDSGSGTAATAGNGSEAAASSSVSSTADVTKGINVTGVPLVNEKQTLKIATVVNDGEPSSEDIKFYQTLENETNVHVEWEDTLLSAWPDKKAIILASGDLPDAFIGQYAFTDTDLLNYGTAGKFISIESYLDTYAPNLTAYLNDHPEWKKQIIAPDGQIYGIPSIDDGYTFTTNNILYINQDWLTKLNLQMPATLDEFEQVLKAFKEREPNGNNKADEIPWELPSPSLWSNDWMSFFGICDLKDVHVYAKNGAEAAYAPVQSEYKEAVKWLNKVNSEGLLDKEMFTQDSKSLSAKLKAPERIVGVLQGWRSSAWALDANDKTYVPLVPPKGPSGQATWYSPIAPAIMRGAFVVTSSCKIPELAIRWADNLLTADNSIQEDLSLIFGEHLEKTADNKLKEIRPLDWNREGEINLSPGNQSRLFVLTKENVARIQNPPPVVKEKTPLDEMLKPYFPTTFSQFPNVFFDAEESQAILQYQTDINPYVTSQYAHWVLEGGIDAEWDAYVKKLNDMKLQDLLAIYQKALDRFNAK